MEAVTQTAGFLKTLRDNWFIILFIGSIVIGWSDVNTKVQYIEQRVNKLEAIAEAQQKSNNDITGAVIEIKANYLFIKEKLERLDRP